MVDPLQKLFRKGQNLEWVDQQSCTFKLVKESLEDAKIMTYWKQFRKTRLKIASPFALGAILEQKLEHSVVYEVVAFASRLLTDVERRHSQTEREGLAVVWGYERFQFFLLGVNFELFTDHKAFL